MASGYNRRPPGVDSFNQPRSYQRGVRGRRNQTGGNRSGGGFILGFNALQNLRGKDPDDIVLDLASERGLPAFKTLLRKTDMSPEMIELVVEVLARACDTNSPEYFNKLLVELPKSLFVILNIKGYIARLSMRGITSNGNSFIERIVKLFSEILRRIPSAFDSLPLGDLEQAVDVLARRGQISGDVIQSVQQLKVIKEESLEKEKRKAEQEKQRRIRSRNPVIGAVGPPPEDFRELTIIPQHDDIFTDKQPYLRKNIVRGAYENLDHYLDVQFRLLREDFLRPLREGILDLVTYGIKEKQGIFKDIRVYKNVKVLYPVCSSSGLRHHIQFDNSSLKRVRWENSKRLIFGSLLCLSKDHFKTFVFATVADRDPRELTKGKLTVQFLDTTFDLQDFSRKNVYEMVETTAYFEAYSPILEGLQETKDNDLPFQRYLVDCNKDIQSPQYVQTRRFGEAPSFDFSSILTDSNASSLVDARLQSRFRHLSLYGSNRVDRFQSVPVLSMHRWPSMEQLGLDESQYKALQIALTKEIAVIQGPPGTGKTYLGLKIAKLLLNNTNTWIHGEPSQEARGKKQEASRTPILVICYTNHALDQFLEGIYDFYGSNENKIVRIGGRSKSEKLKDCNLNAIKKKSRIRAPQYVGRGIAEVYSKLEGVKKKMEIASSVLKKCWQNILYEKTLQRSGVVQQQHLSSLMSLTRGQPEQGTVVLQWLNLVAGEEWAEQEQVIIGEDVIISFNGMEMANRQGFPLANVDFSFCVNIKTAQGGNIVSNLPENRRWMNDCKALCVGSTGVVRFISGGNILCESRSCVNDDRWHEIAVVYSNEDKSLTLYIDKRMERRVERVHLSEENEQYQMKIGAAPLNSGHGLRNFVGSIKKFVYYPSTKYNEFVRGDENVEYEIDFMQDQRRVDDEEDAFFNGKSQGDPVPDDFAVIDPSKLTQRSGEWEVQDKKRERNRITFNIRKQLQSDDVMTDEEAMGCHDVWQLPVKQRWRLYRKWVRDISQQHQNTIASVQNEYDRGMKELQELHNAKNYELLREAHVIGMTTTGAAKQRKLLQRIKPKITIVEEAAEVLESHIITALTGGCEHLILIGDHKQLRPKPTVFQLGLDYQLDISLFERMVENRMPFACLRAQHRMRPEISIMMRPIYDNLEDHESVLNFETIKGINKNIFFVDHQVKEDASDENRSHSNIHEAKFIGSLCKYLLQQGYSPSQITVLTPYTGQLFQLRKFVPREEDLRICVVDNFQGEENDIILLSLVRSQEMDPDAMDERSIRRLIGFLAIDNRICVSLSRAKKGFFCIGNLTLMRSANDLWSKILDDMERRSCVGKSLPLACQNHPSTITQVSDDSDFNKAPNGGCNILCQARLNCGHRCEQICHPTDPNHEEYDCRKRCAKKCTRGHPCKRLCFQKCNNCMEMVLKVIPQCNHDQMMPCHQDPSTFQCNKPCPKKLPCGHACPKTCGEACVRKCKVKVLKTWLPCDHSCNTECHVDPTNTECPHPCGSLLKCEHICGGTCGGCKQGRIHVPCSSRCGRVQFCDHQCKVPCTKNCPPCSEICPNRCAHSRCQNKCGEQCKKCNESCKWKCKHFRCTKLCGEICDRPRCDKPCKKILKKCGHLCPGLCGEPCPDKCLVCDKDELTEILFGSEDEEGARFLKLTDCGHVFEVTGMDKYIDMEKEKLENGQSTSIQMIKCPKCKMAIRRSLRYGNIVKTILRDFEGVKAAISSAGRTSQRMFRAKVMEEIASAHLEIEFPREESTIVSKLSSIFTDEKRNVVENQVRFLKFMIKLRKIITEAESMERNQRPISYRNQFWGPDVSADEPEEVQSMKHEQEVLLQWVMKERERFSEQELEDFNEELHRARQLFSYLSLSLEIRKRNISLSDLEIRCIAHVKQTLETGNKLNEKENDYCTKTLQYITNKNALRVKYTTVTDEEKEIIVKAIGLSQGHWFKCPKGHIYCIGECGGATAEGTCPECGSRIGGTQHRLLADNSLAPEMDGASHAAWSDTANNMGNWDLRRLR